MKRLGLLLIIAAAITLVVATPPVEAQRTSSGLRGIVSDEQSQPVADVEVEIQYKGEGPKKVYHVKTNKKGGFVRVGLDPGPYTLIFNKEGYKKHGIEMYLSLGGSYSHLDSLVTSDAWSANSSFVWTIGKGTSLSGRTLSGN